MKKYAELGFCGLSMDYQYGGSQLPLHAAFLARLPFLVANDGGTLATSYFRSSEGFTSLYKFCFDGVYGAETDFPNLDKDLILTTIANGINYGLVCLPKHLADVNFEKTEGYVGRHIILQLPLKILAIVLTISFYLLCMLLKVERASHSSGD